MDKAVLPQATQREHWDSWGTLAEGGREARLK